MTRRPAYCRRLEEVASCGMRLKPVVFSLCICEGLAPAARRLNEFGICIAVWTALRLCCDNLRFDVPCTAPRTSPQVL